MSGIDEMDPIEKNSVGFLILDEDGKILYADSGAKKLTIEGMDIEVGKIIKNIPVNAEFPVVEVNYRDETRPLKAEILSEPVETGGRALKVLTVFASTIPLDSSHTSVSVGERLNSVFFDMMESLLIIDSSNGLILWANPCACSTFGYPQNGLVGEHFTCIFPPGSEIRATNVLNEVVCADGVFLTQSFQRSDGQILYMDLTASLIPWEGESSAILAVFRDASERKKMEDLRLDSERLRSFSELSAGIAHHFNNMLQVIIGFAGLAQAEIKSAPSTQVKQRLEQIIASSNTAATAIRNLQDFARFNERTDSTFRNVVNLKSLAQRAIDSNLLWWKTQSERLGIVVSLDTDFQDDCYISVNEESILEVMSSLVKNALESFSENGTVKVGVECSEHEAKFYVRDNGVGIKESDVKRIFDPFWTTKGPAKSGLGLPSAMGIVKQNDGEISVESTEGAGSIFTVKFPRAKKLPLCGSGQLSEESGGKTSVLVIDEEAAVLEALSDGLISKGYSVYAANSVSAGLKILDIADVNIIVSDCGTQDMSGWDLGRILKNKYPAGEGKRPIVILLTAWGCEEASRQNPSNTGVDLVLQKPVSMDDLVQFMKDLRS